MDTARALLLACSFGAASGGCQSEPQPAPPAPEPDREPAIPEIPVVHETEYTTVAISEDNPHRICGGTLAKIDRHIETLSEILDVEPEPIEIYWYEKDPNSGRPAIYFDFAAIVTDDMSLLHELGHAVTLPVFGRSDTLFVEGIANAFDGRTSRLRYNRLPSESLGQDVRGSGHFSRWLVETYGPEAFKMLFDRPEPSTEELFKRLEDAYGMPIEDLETEFKTTAPAWYPQLGTCDGLERIPWPQDSKTFRYDTTSDCNSPFAFGHTGDDDEPYFMAFVLEIPPEIVGSKFLAPVVLPDSTGNLGNLTPCNLGKGPPGETTDPELFNSAVSPYLLGEFQNTPYLVELPFLEDGEHVAVQIEIQDP